MYNWFKHFCTTEGLHDDSHVLYWTEASKEGGVNKRPVNFVETFNTHRSRHAVPFLHQHNNYASSFPIFQRSVWGSWGLSLIDNKMDYSVPNRWRRKQCNWSEVNTAKSIFHAFLLICYLCAQQVEPQRRWVIQHQASSMLCAFLWGKNPNANTSRMMWSFCHQAQFRAA